MAMPADSNGFSYSVNGESFKFTMKGRKEQMKNNLLKVAYGLLIPAIVALLAICCSASAVWGS